ncbi:MAG: biotin--[acetyl-CoA-carboxylase] ligase, partial [Alphaproteobacteria bacterium]
TPGLSGPATARLGHEIVEGRADGVAADGALRLRLADGGLRLISAGDVFFGEGG